MLRVAFYSFLAAVVAASCGTERHARALSEDGPVLANDAPAPAGGAADPLSVEGAEPQAGPEPKAVIAPAIEVASAEAPSVTELLEEARALVAALDPAALPDEARERREILLGLLDEAGQSLATGDEAAARQLAEKALILARDLDQGASDRP